MPEKADGHGSSGTDTTLRGHGASRSQKELVPGWLQLTDPEQQEPQKPYELRTIQGQCKVGRSSESDIVISKEIKKASREHCVIMWNETGATLINKSRNGTILLKCKPNSEQLQLHPGDKARVDSGDVVVIDRLLISVALPSWQMNHQRVIQLKIENLKATPSIKIASDDVIVADENTKAAFVQAARYAMNDEPIHIKGESGSGKELVAKLIHHWSIRQDAPFIPVNCADFDQLADTKLFGHARGAFTGAHREHIGYIEEANRGTLFLDEIDQLSLETQAKLLRVIQDGRFRRVGDSRDRQVSIRILSATHQDLLALQRAGRFRADLFYRLGMCSVRVPPLRERISDIPFLARKFVALASSKLRCKVYISQSAIARLCELEWRGNIRELSGFIHALITRIAEDCTISADHVDCFIPDFYPAEEKDSSDAQRSPKDATRSSDWYQERLKRGMSQLDISKELNISKQAVNQELENYKLRPIDKKRSKERNV